MSEQTVTAVVGATIGFVIGGPAGAQIGFGLGMAIGAPRPEEPKPGDLSAPLVTFGTPIPDLFGTVVTSGIVTWISELRATEVEAEGGKGGGGQVVGYTYSADMKFVVGRIKGAHDVIALTRVWRNGKLIWSARAGADADTAPASANTEHFDDIEVRLGGPSQMPWPPYEAAVGSSLAVADRHVTTICITNARFGNSKAPPVYKFEVITAGSAAPGDTFWLLNANDANGTTTATDTSSWGHTVAPVGYEQQAASAAFGASGFVTNTTGYSLTGGSAMSVPWNAAAEGLSGEGRMRITGEPGTGFTICQVSASGFNMRCYIDDDLSPDNRRLVLVLGAQSLNAIDVLGPTDYPLPRGTYFHWALDWDADTQTASFYVNGVLAHRMTYSGTVPTTTTINDVSTGGGPAATIEQDGIRFTRRYRRFLDDFTPPATAPTDDTPGPWTPGTVDLDDVVATLLNRTPITSALRDLTALNGVPVRGYAATGNIRAAIEQLAAFYNFGAVCSDKLYMRRRAGASALTIPFADLGAGVDQASDEPLELDRGGQDEVPRRISLSYVNINSDHDVGTVTGDRGEGRVDQNDTAQVAIVATPGEAQAVVDGWVHDRRAAATRIKASVSEFYARLEPTDAFVITDRDGTTYRVRMATADEAQSVKAMQLVLDDASVFTQPGIAGDYTTPTINVPNPGDTTLDLMDVPILRDADNDAGFYAAVSGGDAWPGAIIAESGDGITYSQRATVTSRATRGRTTTVLGAWSGGNVMDHANSVTVQINGQAASYTHAQVLAGTARAWLIGNEVVVARTATLVSAGVYTLSGLLRGARGTEWAMSAHVVGERVIALDALALRRLTRELGQLDIPFQFKAPTLGRSLATTSAQTFTDTGVGLKPFSPAEVRVARDASNNATITVRRRSRLSHRFLRESVDTPLGEANESYSVDAYTDGTFATIAATFTITGATGSFTAAAQSTAGLTPGDPLYLAVHQLSAVVGRGYPKRVTA